MQLVRRLERRLETLLDGVAGRVFRGPLHPSELAGRLIRQADLSLTETPLGPVAANHFRIRVNPSLLTPGAGAGRIAAELAAMLEEASAERGWRMEGPASVSIEPDPAVGEGAVRCEAEVAPGPRRAWALLRGEEDAPLTVNRCVVGRSRTADTMAGDDTTSRRHALVWREAERVFIRDLGSSNGTSIDGRPVGRESAVLEEGSVVALGSARYRFELR